MYPIPSQHTDLFDIKLTPNHNPMDPNLYKAVKNGDVKYLDQHTDLFDNQVTPNHNTILHVAAHFGKSECVARILQKKPCHLIRRVNSNGENPLHIAVREQHYDVVQALINGAEELDRDPESGGGTRLQILRATNVDGDTPLHLAVREGDDSFVRLLADTDSDFQHPPNKARETPLYLAAERNNGDSMVESILVCKSTAYTGPGDRTALHAAVIFGNIGEFGAPSPVVGVGGAPSSVVGGAGGGKAVATTAVGDRVSMGVGSSSLIRSSIWEERVWVRSV
ncbi:hypothetical protein Vadar_013904 [Vaccinium darrowii]|uniref:Uncharacterized protein n=1 Tax=Vaccinium darrowii TaxID=229202 RepID=A0ACB7YVL2_9ERIC|nr:hypothetical protein Vadar_013904 [Vaccinium darrowii]